MTLAAIYIFDYHLFEKPFTLNFGGKYIYNIVEDPKTINITRKLNSKYIQGFFDESNILLNISAIVGSNGAGKTSLLYEIIDGIISNKSNNIIIFEEEDTAILHNFKRIGKAIGKDEFELRNIDVDINTVYYSPFLDFKAEIDGVDLSFDNLLGKDLENIFDLAPQGGLIYPKEILKQANYKRIRNLKISESAKPIKEIFDFPDDDLHRVTFTRYRIDAGSDDINFHNTPLDFQPFLKMLFLRIRNEADTIRNSKRDTPNDQFNLQKNLLKNYILMDVFCILIKLMEIENTYLKEGHFNSISFENIEDLSKEKDAFELIQFWLEDYYYSKGNRKNLPDEETLALIYYLFDFIEKIEYDDYLRGSTYFNWDIKSIFLSSEELDELYKIEQKFINALSKYYLGKDINSQTYYDTVNQIPNYINLEPSSRNLSSGETAMLNLFSRIHEYFDNKMLQLPIDKKYEYYLLLLDEADLGFHPIWKRRFVKTLVRFTTEFFKKIGSRVQIIFTTHDPLTLSDLPNNNILYINKSEESFYRTILANEEPKRPSQSFGANLTDLLADSFFLDDSLMGDFAREKIQKTIDWLSDNDRNLEYKKYHKDLINIVDEPILRTKLEEMYFEAFKDEADLEQKIQHLKDLAERYGLDVNFEEQ